MVPSSARSAGGTHRTGASAPVASGPRQQRRSKNGTPEQRAAKKPSATVIELGTLHPEAIRRPGCCHKRAGRQLPRDCGPLPFANQIGTRILARAGPGGSLPVTRIALAIALGACAGSGALAADLPQPVPAPPPICSAVASWTDWSGAVCVKYLCPGIDVQIRCFH